jgi:hypothetical protein
MNVADYDSIESQSSQGRPSNVNYSSSISCDTIRLDEINR